MKLYELTAHEIRDMLRKKEICAKEVLDITYARIDEVEDKVNSYIALTRDTAYKKAAEVDKAIRNREELPDLAGIPMAVKDNICTEGIETTCASKILKGFVPPYDSEVCRRLGTDGSIMVGKTNMDEFAMGSSTENSSVKATRNPWDLKRVPGGSSGGSAAAVASGEAFFSLGSDTGGSVRQPAALCGVVGMKPTYGLVSRYGLIAFASSLDQIGPLTKDVEDCALVMNSISGYDSKDTTSLDIPRLDYKKALVDDVKGLRIGLPKEYFNGDIDAGVASMVLEGVKLLEEMGARAEEMSLPHSKYALPAYYIAASAEASSNLSRYDGIRYGYRPEGFKNLEELYVKTRSEGFGAEAKRRIMLGTYALSSGYYDAYYRKALQVRTLIKEEFERAFQKYDIIISPTTPSTAFKVGEKARNPLSMYLADICTVPVNIAGITAISIPCGVKDGLPVGMQIIGRPLGEKTVIQAAYAYEKNSRFRDLRPGLQ